MARLVKSRRGAVTVQVALFLPILIVILVGAFEFWKVQYLQQVLNDAAYQGVRLLVSQANAPEIEGLPARDMRSEAEMMIRRYVATQAFSPITGEGGGTVTQDDAYHYYALDDSVIRVDISPSGHWPPICGEAVIVSVSRNWVVGRGSGPSGQAWLPFLGRRGWITGTAGGTVQCEREKDVYGVP